MVNKYPHKVTVWQNNGVDRYGAPDWSLPITVNCRWEDTQRIYINAEGREVRGSSTIYPEEDEIGLFDHIYRGESTKVEPEATSSEVRDKRVITNLRGTRTEYRVII